MESDVSDIERIWISHGGEFDEGNCSFLDFMNDGTSQCLFVWKGDRKNAEDAYALIQQLIQSEIKGANFGKLSRYKATCNKYAYIMMPEDSVLNPQQKYSIIEGLKSQGYTTAIRNAAAKVAGFFAMLYIWSAPYIANVAAIVTG